MIVGIVGAEAAKFTKMGREECLELIYRIVHQASEVVSGACPLGGVDIWAVEVANDFGVPVKEFPPKTRSWETGFKPRNLQIARRSDIVYCITVAKLPEGFTGRRFPYCYHCANADPKEGRDHVKSGGCWTMYKALEMGKQGTLCIVSND